MTLINMQDKGLSNLVSITILTALYFVGGLLGQEWAFMSKSVALVWPPAGIALAAILLFGYRFWPGVALGACLFSFMNGMPLGFFTLGTAVGNTVGAVVCVFLLERFIHFHNSIDRVRDAVGFIVLACLIGTTVNATFNVVSLIYSNQLSWDDLFPQMLQWWVPNAMAGLVITPFILAWGTPSTKRWDWPLILEGIICGVLLVAGTLVSLDSNFSTGNYPLAYLPYPFLVWGALRLGQRGATTGTLVVAGLAIYSLLQNRGPFVVTGPGAEHDSLMLIGSYIGILAVSNLLLATAAIERERAQAAVAESEKKYRAVVEDQTELISRFRADGTLVFTNGAFCRFYGQSAETFVGQVHPQLTSDNAKLHRAQMAGLTAESPVANYDYQLWQPQNRLVWHQCSLRQLFDPWGQPSEFQMVENDITQRKQAEEALRRSEEMFQLISQNVEDLIAVTDCHGKRLFNSRSYQSILGDPDKLRGTNAFEQIHPDDRDKVKENFRRTLETGVGQRLEFRFLLKDGSVRHIESVGSFVRGEAGQEDKLVSIARDITERKQIEQDLANARDAALVAMRQKAEFLANMSHEIRTPLNGVIGLVNLLRRTHLDAHQQEYANNIRVCSDALLSIINDILDFSKMEAGKLSLEVLDFHLPEAVEEPLDLLAESAQAKGIELMVCVQPEVPALLRGDPGRLRQILVNLMSNAVKFTPQGQVVLTVSLVRQTDKEAVLRFKITDTGIGISLEAQQLLFQSFTQADGSTTRRYGGTGLGLAICRQLVTLMNGQIGVESIPGRGSTFWFVLPLEKQPVLFPKPAALGPCRVLVVSNHAVQRQMLHQYLQGWKMSAESASQEQEALAKLRQARADGLPFQVALLDLQLPDTDGLALARAIIADPQIAEVRLIFVKAFGQCPPADTLAAAGIQSSLTKPLKPSQLFNCILNLTHPASESADPPTKPTPPAAVTPLAPRPLSAQPLRVLLAEDNHINQLIASEQITNLGCQVDAVADGREALAAFERQVYQVILMDCQMPEMDGYEATRRIRQLEAERAQRPGFKGPVIIIALTAHALPGDRAKCLAAGMDDYLSKPIEEDALRAALERCLQAAVSRAPAAAVGTVAAPDPVLDTQRLLRITGNDPGKVIQLMGLYVAQTEDLLGKLDAAVRAGEVQQVAQLAHKCCGASLSCGANTIAVPLRALENKAREGQLGQADACLREAHSQFGRLRLFLEDYLKSLT